MDLHKLKQYIDALSKQAKQLDEQRKANKKPLFNTPVFNGPTDQLLPCVQEITNTLNQLEKEQIKIPANQEQLTHLSKKLIDQINAIEREIATMAIREQEKNLKYYVKTSINQLYQDLAQHQNWEQRLQQKQQQIEMVLKQNLNPSVQLQANNHLILNEKRLLACQAARRKIEQKIAMKEKKK